MKVSPEPEVATRKSGPVAAAGVSSDESAEIARFIANGDSGAAVEAAKKFHKRCKTSASEALLVDAYIARIATLISRDLEVEARNLMERVRGLYPSARARMPEIKSLFGARKSGGIHKGEGGPKGDLDSLLSPLNDPSLPDERRTAIYKAVASQVSDLGQLAESQVLPAEHPLRKTAFDLLAALNAVTSGPVDDQTVGFPEISRQSPLACWKMLLRAMAAFYRRDHGLCERCLAAIDPSTAPARLIPALRTLMGQKHLLGPASELLVKQAASGIEALRSKLQKLEQSFGRSNQAQTVRDIREALSACKQDCPAIVERLRQHIFVRSFISGFEADRAQAALDGAPVVADAYFWRLFARATEDPRMSPFAVLLACASWEEFRRHAKREGWLPEVGPEVAALYLHMADLLNRIPEEELFPLRRSFVLNFDGFEIYYRKQSPEIRAVMVPKRKIDTYFLYPKDLLERACQTDPCFENFQRWFDWATHHSSPVQCERIAERWSANHPKDVRPLLHLMELAEKGNALQRAFDYMQKAEMLDGLNPQVRKARLRLLVAIAVRHLQKKKARLSEQDLEAIEALPQIEQGDRKAFVVALRWVSSMLWGSQEEREARSAMITQLLGSEVAAQILMKGVAKACKLQDNPITLSVVDSNAKVAPDMARACALGDDMGFPFEVPPAFFQRVLQELASPDFPLDMPGLAALGEAALRASNWAVAYAIAGTGLAGNAAGHGTFLYMRARALPPWEMRRHDSCLGAASELARRHRDHILLDRIGQWREEHLDGMVPFEADLSMSSEQIDKVIERERQQKEFPKTQPGFGPDDYEDDELGMDRADLPPGFEQFEAMMEDMADEFGMENVEAAMNELLNGPLERKKKKKSQRKARSRSTRGVDFDLPF